MNVQHAPSNDQTLRWTMRFIGLMLAVGSTFFLIKNIGLGMTDDLFFGASATLGVLTFGASLWPLPRTTSAPPIPNVAPRAVPQPHERPGRNAARMTLPSNT